MTRHHILGARSGATIAAAALLLAACATPYQPLGAQGGFSDKQLAPDRYSVEFRGNGNTPADLVGNMYLYRCAELTVNGKFDLFRHQRAGQPLSSAAWDGALASLADPGRDGLTLFRSSGVTYVPVYVPARPVTVYRVTGEVHMGRYGDVPSTQKAWDARAVMKVLEPIVKGSQRPALTLEQVAKVALVSGRGQPAAADSGTTLDDLRGLLGQP
ncbi:MAG: CC0125/CC1285 family lipoprotein [Ramlibacter sp.]